MATNRGSKYHPSRVSDHQKKQMARRVNIEEYTKRIKAALKKKITPVDLSKSDWSKK